MPVVGAREHEAEVTEAFRLPDGLPLPEDLGQRGGQRDRAPLRGLGLLQLVRVAAPAFRDGDLLVLEVDVIPRDRRALAPAATSTEGELDERHVARARRLG